jgi:hypothetical protein
MKRHFPLILSAFAGLTFTAAAEDKFAHKPVLPDHADGRTSRPRAEHLKGAAKASTLIGMTVKSPLDETLGKVTDLVLDVESGRIVAVIVATGGFLGFGSELSAVPPTSLRLNPGRESLQLDASKVLLANAPHFKPGEWPDFTHTGYVGGVYRAYQLEPYFRTDTDNTGRTMRDRDGQALTPFDQGSSKNDMAISAQIRREIIAGKDLSVNAHNVKVITLNGRVTLRGQVKTAAEKVFIDAIVHRLVGSRNLDSQLEAPATASRN